MKISRHENFAVSRSKPKNREIKMPRKTILLPTAKLKCMKMHFFDLATKIHKNFCLFGVKMPIFTFQRFGTAKLKCREIQFFSWTAKLKWREMQFSAKKPRTEIKIPRNFHAAKISCNKVIPVRIN